MSTWLDKSPSNVPGVADQTKVNYIEIRQDRNNASNLLAIADYKTTANWVSRVGYSNDYGDNWNWTKLGSSVNELTGTYIINIDVQSNPQKLKDNFITWQVQYDDGFTGPQSMAKMSNNFYLILGADYSSIVPQIYPYHIVGIQYVTSTSVNATKPYELEVPTGHFLMTTPRLGRITELGSNRVAVARKLRENVSPAETSGIDRIIDYPMMAVVEAYPGSMNSGSTKGVFDYASTVSQFSICTLDNDRFFIATALNHTFDFPHEFGIKYKRVETTGRVLTPDNLFNTLDANNRRAYNMTAITNDSSKVIICCMTLPNGCAVGSGANENGAIIVDIQGNSAIDSGFLPIPALNGVLTLGGAGSKIAPDKIAWVFNNRNASTFDVIIGEMVSDTSMNWGSVYTWMSDMSGIQYPSMSIDTIETNRFIIATDGSTGGNRYTGIYSSIVEVTGTCVNFGITSGSITPSDGDGPYGANVKYKTGGSFVAAYTELNYSPIQPPDLYMVTLNSTGTPIGAARVLSADISAGGTSGYVTYCDDGAIRLAAYDLPALTKVKDVTLSQGTLSEVASKVWWSGVRTFNTFADTLNDNSIWMFGRMDTIASGITPLTHLAKSTDGGTTFTVIDNSLGTDHFGALDVELDGRVNAIANLGAFGAYYRGYATMITINTLPFNTDHRALYHSFDDYLVIGASGNVSIKIAYTKPGAVNWYDLTNNHPANNTITGLGLV